MPTVLIAPGPLRGQPGPFREILLAAGFDDFIDSDGDDTLTEAELRATPARGRRHARRRRAAHGRAPRPRPEAPRDRPDGRRLRRRSTSPPRRPGKIPVTITPGTNQESVAEQTFALLLALTRSIVNNDRIDPRRRLGPRRSSSRSGARRWAWSAWAGSAARWRPRAVAFGMRVVAFDPIADPEFDARHGITPARLRRAARRLRRRQPAPAALTRQTRGLINRETLARMRPGLVS